MCGRVTVRTTPLELARALGLAFDEGGPDALEPGRFNVVPTALLPAVLDQAPGVLTALRWGLVPHWAKEAGVASSLANARSEGVAHKPAFAQAYRGRRCVVVVDGFYEWLREGKRRRPFHFTRADGAPLAFDGLWEEWTPPAGRPLRTCTVLTCAANATLARLHDRMPVILERGAWAAWLAPGAPPEALLVPAAEGVLLSREVSARVNDARNQGPQCLGPPEPEPQLSLF
jgi:putative SOS response-associated peptidase YedK